MPVQCPYCRHALSIKKAKPGFYTPECPDCKRKFQLAVFDDPEKPPVVAAIPAEREKASSALGLAATSPSVPKAVSRPTEPQASDEPTGAFDARATAMPTPAEHAPAVGHEVTADLPRTVRDALNAPSTAGGVSVGDRAIGSDAPTRAVGESPNPGSGGRHAGMPTLLGGYQILSELGRGGMGAVYLARQIWLNRNVALKVMKPQWASNATFVARFTREAYAAAQLTHHNIVQIYDFGEDKGTTYFSTEFVDGQTLGGLIREKRRLDVEEAAGYALQAARGLKYAHDQSMIHRDIKPENLLLNAQGMVKVANLGLVKTPQAAEADEAVSAGKAPVENTAVAGSGADTGQITMANVAIGTPSYMAPEQARDASRVDARADIYSLGCTLYVLVTGRPPFEGRTVLEILSKHQTEAITPPDLVVKRVPKSLSTIILRMTAKKPDDRYGNVDQVIDALEAFLGISSAGPFTPREEHANLLEECVKTFNAAPAARMRFWLMPLFLGVCFSLALLCALTGRPIGAGVFASLGLLTALADFVLVGIRRKTPLFFKVGELIAGARLSEWLTALAALAILGALLMILKLLWIWLGLGFLAIGIAVAIHAGFDRQVEAERRESLAQVEEMLRSLRLQGQGEDVLRQFVCKYSGIHWEEFYEALFGYEAKRDARQRWGHGDRGKSRPKFAAWRDPIAAWLDSWIVARREANETVKLQKIEERSLQSQGENLVSARRKSQRAALAMVATAAEIKELIRSSEGTFMVNRSIASAMRDAAVKPEKVLLAHERGLLPDQESSGIVARVFNLVLGPKVRFLAGAALLAGCIAWMHQNAMISAEQAGALVEAAKAGDVQAIQSHAEAGIARARKVAARPTETLDLPVIPPRVLTLVSSFGAGAGGLILIVSSFFSGIRIAFFAIPAAAIPVLLPSFWHPALGGLKLDPSLVPSIAGVAILAAGILFGRR